MFKVNNETPEWRQTPQNGQTHSSSSSAGQTH